MMTMMMMTAWEDVASTAPCPALSTQTVATLSTTDADHEQDCLDECSAKQLKSAKERLKNRIIVSYHQAGKQNLWEFARNQFWHDDIPESRGQRGPLRIVDKSYDGSG